MKLLPLLALLLVAQVASAQDAAPAPTDGIHITGRWTLDVRQPDGSLVESHTFHNDLTRNGVNLLINLFTKNNRLATLAIQVGAQQLADKPCTDGDGAASDCLIVEPEDPLFGDPETFELAFEKILDPIVLARYSGTITADRDAEITRVFSRIGSCLYGVSEPCTAANRSNLRSGPESYTDFTVRTLDAPLTVAEGQSVDVRFELSFDY